VLGLIFLKYVSDAFEERQNELREQFQNPEHDYYMDPADYPDGYEEDLAAELEARDYYTEKNVFWVPIEARWQTLRDCAQLPPKAPLPWNKPGKNEPEEMRSVGWLIDNAMDAIERENEKKLKNVLNKDFARTQIDSYKLGELISHFSDTNFHAKEYNGQQLEDLCITWFQETGWQFVYGSAIAPEGVNPERADYRQVILRDRLLAALARINPHIPDAALEQAVHALLTISEPQLVVRNRSLPLYCSHSRQFTSNCYGVTADVVEPIYSQKPEDDKAARRRPVALRAYRRYRTVKGGVVRKS